MEQVLKTPRNEDKLYKEFAVGCSKFSCHVPINRVSIDIEQILLKRNSTDLLCINQS